MDMARLPNADELKAAPHRLLEATRRRRIRRRDVSDALAQMAEITAAGRIPLLVAVPCCI